MALFFYVFNDFLNVEVASLSMPMRDFFSTVLAWVTLLSSLVFVGKYIAFQWRDRGHSIPNLVSSLGESPQVVFGVRLLSSLTVVAAVFISYWYFSSRFLVAWTPAQYCLNALYAAPIALLGFIFTRYFSKRQTEDRAPGKATLKRTFLAIGLKPDHARVRWRYEIFSRRSVASRLAIGGACVFGVMFLILSFRHAPAVALYSAAFLIGFQIYVALAFTLAVDLASIWFEKAAGCSHEDVVRSYSQIAMSCSIGVILLVSSSFLAPHLMRIDTSWMDFAEGLRLGLVAACPVLLFPSLMLQIDGRRPVAQILAGFLITLFISTAIYASWFAMLLLPLAQGYAGTLQRGRLYRA